MFVEWNHTHKPTVLGVATGAVAGLVAITPGAGFVGPISAMIIGAVAGLVCYLAVVMKARLGYDDSLDVVGVHGIGGTWGALATGLFASAAVGGADGLFFGNPAQMTPQIVSVLGTIVYAGVLTWVILKILDATVGLRVSDEDEQMGLDLSQHNESGYAV
jgi:Amt family ammonium transporter